MKKEKGEMTAILCDFGLSGEYSTQTFEVDNPVWCAPEVLRGEPFTLKSDVYSFGVVSYFIFLLFFIVIVI